jgi:hypothetical protein
LSHEQPDAPANTVSHVRDTIFPLPITDTSPAAQAVQIEIQRSLSGEKRLLLAYAMSMFARELSRARIRCEHPEWPEGRVARELLRLAFFPAALPRLQ